VVSEGANVKTPLESETLYIVTEYQVIFLPIHLVLSTDDASVLEISVAALDDKFTVVMHVEELEAS